MAAATRRRVVALLSGGMDSATAAGTAAEEGYELHALAIDYGQRHIGELDSARDVAQALGVASFNVVSIDLRTIGGSALTDEIDVPKDRDGEAVGSDIPVTYVPARNTVFLAIALGAAEVIDADAIVIGVNALDYSGYPDCRPAFLDAFRQVSATGTKRGVEGRPIQILAPLLEMSKADIVRSGLALGVPFEKTLSCYDPVERASRPGEPAWGHCGRCDACRLRARGFEGAGAADPAPAYPPSDR